MGVFRPFGHLGQSACTLWQEIRWRIKVREALAWRDRLTREGSAVNARFAAWLTRSPEHIQVWLELTAIDFELMQWLDRALSGLTDPAAIDRAHAKRRRARTWRLAAALSVVTISAIALWMSGTLRPPQTEYLTRVGELRKDVLVDGTRVDLNTRSHLRVALTDEERLLELEDGELFLEVARDPRPFHVRVAGLEIEDVGTRFSVRKDGDNVSVLVAEGRVKIHGSDSTAVELGAGAMFTRVNGALEVTHLDEAALHRKLAWLGGRVIFDDAPLKDIAAEMNRYNTREIVIADPALGEMRMGGSFMATDPEGFAQAMQRLSGCEVQTTTSREGLAVIRLLKPRR